MIHWIEIKYFNQVQNHMFKLGSKSYILITFKTIYLMQFWINKFSFNLKTKNEFYEISN